jgi:hypothetical protein
MEFVTGCLYLLTSVLFCFLQEVDTLLITNFGELETVMGSVLQSKYVIRGFLSSWLGFSLLNLLVLMGWDPVYVWYVVCLAHIIDHFLSAVLKKKVKVSLSTPCRHRGE